MTHRSIAAKLPEPLFLKLKTTLAHHDLTVRQFLTNAAEALVATHHPITSDELQAIQVDAEAGDDGYSQLFKVLVSRES